MRYWCETNEWKRKERETDRVRKRDINRERKRVRLRKGKGGRQIYKQMENEKEDGGKTEKDKRKIKRRER